MKSNVVPLPKVNPEEHGVFFGDLAFPTGFDEERLLVNVDKASSIARVAGIGGITVIGQDGEKADEQASVGSVNGDGTATFGLTRTPTQTSFVNGVSLFSREQALMQEHDRSAHKDMLYYSPIVISANLSARDQLLRVDKKYVKGLLDPEGHAHFLDRTFSDGLVEAAKQRYGQRSNASKIVGPMIGAAIVGNTLIGSISGYTLLGAIETTRLIANVAFIDMMFARATTRKEQLPFKEWQFSIFAGLDRKLGAQALARTSRFVKVRE